MVGVHPDIDADPAQAWRKHAERVRQVISDDAVPAIAYDGYFGPTTLGATLERFYVWDMYVHSCRPGAQAPTAAGRLVHLLARLGRTA